jgi:hypothetical protein
MLAIRTNRGYNPTFSERRWFIETWIGTSNEQSSTPVTLWTAAAPQISRKFELNSEPLWRWLAILFKRQVQIL